MFFETKDIENELIEFVQSNQFNNFKLIIESAALTKFSDMQKTNKTYEQMLADKAILNFYMTYPDVLTKKVEAIARRKEAELKEKINKAQVELG